MKKICLITGSRSEYERLYILLRRLAAESAFELGIVTMGPMAADIASGQISEDGFDLWGRLTMKNDDHTVAASHTVGALTRDLSELISKIAPDLVLIPGDRFEQLATATVAVCQQIPLAHLWGGELTLGALDDQVRHMLTKAAHLHLVANKDFARRVQQMGEEAWRICLSGSPALDVLAEQEYLDRAYLEKDLDIDLSQPTAVVTFHPETLAPIDVAQQIDGLITAIKASGLQFVITYPNSDQGCEIIITRFRDLASALPNKVRLVDTLGRQRYFSLLRQVRFMLGNSSSGLVEAPLFKLPVVNIGLRQEGRVQGGNVVQADYSSRSIGDAIQAALALDRENITSPYGDTRASSRIVAFLEETLANRSRHDLLFKRFVDLPEGVGL